MGVAFAPTATGALSAQLSIPSNDPDTPELSVSLSGTGAPPPDISVSPPSHDFGNVMAGGSSADQTFTVTNTGGSGLVVGAVSVSGADSSVFMKKNDNCSGQVLAPGSSCAVTATFNPTGSGARNAYLSISSNDPDAPDWNILLTGTGVVIAVPVSPAATALSSSSISFKWSDKSNNETGFQIEMKTGGCTSGGTWMQVAQTAANTWSYTSTGLGANTTYSYRVRAFNSVGNSGYSACASATTAAAGTPDTPTGLLATSTSSSAVRLTWKVNSSNETGFRVFRKTGAGTYARIASPLSNATSYTDSTAADNTSTASYTYYVQSCNALGCSRASVAAVVPFAPSNLIAAAGGPGAIDLSWTDASLNESGFQIYRKPGSCSAGGTWVAAGTAKANEASYRNSGLAPGNTYSYKVRAYRKSVAYPYSTGYSMWTNCAEATSP